MGTIAGSMEFVDLESQGMPRVIATAVLQGPGGVALVDPGPGSCLPTLRAGLERLGVRPADVTAIVLTHIHLDHAGATGSLVRDNPRIRVFVHERGARHLVDPARLIDSATRLYGSGIWSMWGEFLAVPAEHLQVLTGGERIDAAGRALDVVYTPGHASHHVCYFEASTGVAFVGDTGGGRIGSSSFVMPPTPPPDIDLDAWNASLDRILAWHPETLFLTHFGPSDAPPAHVDALRARLSWAAAIVRSALERHPDPADDAAASALAQQALADELRRHVPETEARSYELAIPLDHCYQGLARYWRKRGLA